MKIKIVQKENGQYEVDKLWYAEQIQRIAKEKCIPSCFGSISAIIHTQFPEWISARSKEEAEKLLKISVKAHFDELNSNLEQLEECALRCEFFDKCYKVALVYAVRRHNG